MSVTNNNFQTLLEEDEVRVAEDKVGSLHFSSVEAIVEEDGIKKPATFFRKHTGIILEADWCKRKKEWTYFVKFQDKKTQKEYFWWFLASELKLVE